MPMEAQRGSSEITLPMPNLGTRWEWLFNGMPWVLYPLERAPVHVV